MKLFVIGCVFFLGTSIQLLAQSPKHYLFHNYTTRDGLASNIVYCINQDKQGFIWFGTNSGVTRFDGYKFDNRMIPKINDKGSYVQCIEKDKNGNLSVAGILQGIHVQQANGVFRQYLMSPERIGKNTTNTIKACADGSLLVSDGRHLYQFKNSKFKLLYDAQYNKIAVNTITVDKQDNIWFGGIFGLAMIKSGDKTNTPLFIPELNGISIIKILFENDRNLLIGTINGLYRITFQQSSFSNKTYRISKPIQVLSEIFINHLQIDLQSNLWVSTTTNGVFKIRNDKVLLNLKKENGLPSNDVMCSFQDKEGTLWFANGSEGVSKLSDFNKYSFPEIEKQLSQSSSIQKDAYGRNWFYGDGNLYITLNGKITLIDLKKTALKNEGIVSLYFPDSGNVWIETPTKLFSMPINATTPNFSLLKFQASLKTKKALNLRLFAEDKDGNIWVGTDNNLFILKNKQLIPCKINHADSSKISPYKLLEDRFGSYWLSDHTYGLYHMHLKTKQNGALSFDNVKAYKSLKNDSSFVTAWIQDLNLDKEGYLWESSLYTGVYKLSIDKNGVTNSFLYSSQNGLPNNCISEIITDKKNNIWFSSHSGAISLKKNKAGKEIFSLFNSKIGLGDEVYSIYPEDSVVYIHFAEGYYSMNPNLEEKEKLPPPQVVISRVSLMGLTDTLALQATNDYHLKYNRNFIGIDFASISFIHENGILYQTKLEGLDKTWSEYSDRHYVTYNSLPPGHYIFKVRAKSAEGIETKSITTYKFIITPPFYRTWWFIILFITIIISVLYIVYNYRINQLLKIERMRTRIASDLHDDIGSTLSSISILSEILSKQLDNTKSTDMIHKIGTNARLMLDSMDDIIWVVNPANDKFQNLGLRIREYAIPLFESKDIAFQIHFSDNLATLQLSMDLRRNIYLIAKEAVNNLVKYAQSKAAKIEITDNNGMLTLIVTDDGIGFDSKLNTTRNGLKNMKRRAEQINGKLRLKSSPGNGSIIELTVKIL